MRTRSSRTIFEQWSESVPLMSSRTIFRLALLTKNLAQANKRRIANTLTRNSDAYLSGVKSLNCCRDD